MDPTKTRLWNANALGLALPNQVPAQTPKARATQMRGSGVVERTSAAPEVSADAARPVLMHATRILPIEKLLPHAVRKSAPAAANARRSVPPPPPLPRTSAPSTPAPSKKGLRYGGHAVVGLLTLIAVSAWWQWPTLARVHTRPLLIAKAATQPMLAAETATPSEPRAALPEPSADPSVKRPQAAQAAMPRQAVDLVIAGDYARAQAVYLKLARDHPEIGAFREAARILAQRHKD